MQGSGKRQRVRNGNAKDMEKKEEEEGQERYAEERCLRLMGVMSGTSLDGVDVAIADYWEDDGGLQVKLLFSHTFEFPSALKDHVLAAIRKKKVTLSDISRLNFQLGELFANTALQALSQAKVAKRTIHGICSHGQTLWHEPPHSTLQLGEPNVISAKTGITTVADFRVGDVAVGGHGAPLVSTLDCLLLSKPYQGHRAFYDGPPCRAIQNIGGIGNVTFVPISEEGASQSSFQPIAFDTGPGNVWMDMAATWATNGKQSFDKDGALADKGVVNAALLEELLDDPYYQQKPPKTTGRELYTEAAFQQWVKRSEELGCSPVDFVRTLTELTAASIVIAYSAYCPGDLVEVVVAGGGSANPVLMDSLKNRLVQEFEKDIPVKEHFEATGIPADSKEAIAFGLLGYLCLRGETNNIPSCTGGSSKAIMGKVCPGRNWLEVLGAVLP